MKVFRIKDVPVEPANSPLFTGGEVTRQQMVTNDFAKDFTFNIVNFGTGARNYFHTHTSDQVLLITEGTGIVATRKRRARGDPRRRDTRSCWGEALAWGYSPYLNVPHYGHQYR